MAKSNTRIKKVRMALLTGKIYISDHSKLRMLERGYEHIDIIRGILNGIITETQMGYDPEVMRDALRFVIEGFDLNGNPIVIVLVERLNGYCLVTAMPPIDKNRFKNVI